MDIPGFDARYEPPAVKAGLPVEWALGHLFGIWGAGSGEMFPCPLPGHQDDTPSFNLWAPNEGGVLMRWGCFGCGMNGDVIDLIQEARAVGFTDACTIAVDELLPIFQAAEWEPSDVLTEQRLATPPQVLEAELSDLEPKPEYLERFLERKLPDIPPIYLHEKWAWKGAFVGMPALVFPHRDWEGTLRGIRYRSLRRDNRWTRKGSRFTALYGAHHDQRHPVVVLTEGETDTVCADWQFRSDAIDVLGLASGAAQKPPPEALEHLSGRTVWTAFDGDMAGRIATNRWRNALEGIAEVRQIAVPDGQDVCSLGQPLVTLMED